MSIKGFAALGFNLYIIGLFLKIAAIPFYQRSLDVTSKDKFFGVAMFTTLVQIAIISLLYRLGVFNILSLEPDTVGWLSLIVGAIGAVRQTEIWRALYFVSITQ